MNTATLLLGVLFSAIGLGYFIYGKKQQQIVPLVCGIVLIIYPYFIANAVLLTIIGLALCIAPKFIRV